MLALLPLGYIVLATRVDHRLGRASPELVFRPRVGELLLEHRPPGRSARSSACAVLGVGAAWLVERTSAARSAGSGTCCWSPRWPCRPSSTATRWVSLRPAWTTGLGGAVLITTLSYFPFVYLPVAAACAGSTRRWRRPPARWACGRLAHLPRASCCRSCGRPCSAAACWSRCTCWPSSARCRCCASPPSPRPSTTSTRAAFNGPGATMLAGVLVLLCLLLLLAELRLRGRRGYARIGRGAARPARPAALGRWLVARRCPPLGGARRPRPRRAAGQPGPLDGDRRLDRLRLGGPGRRDRDRRSAWPLAAAAVTDGAGPARSAGWPCAPRGRRSPRRSSAAPTSAARCPGIVVALALVTLAIRVTPGSTRPRCCSAAYAILFLPRAMVSVRSALDAVAAPLSTTSPRSLGTAPRRTGCAGSTLPLLAPGIRRGRGAGLPRRRHRADRDPAARPHRHDHAGHRLLVGEQRPRRTARPPRTP